MRGYKLKITLSGSKPPIWRTCILPEGLALRELPDVFERVMGWRNSEHDPVRLARFVFPDANESFESDGTGEDGQPVRWSEGPIERRMPGVTVQNLERQELKKDEPLIGPLFAKTAEGSGEFLYTFLPGASEWEHRVRIVKVIENAPNYPELIGHAGECPPAEYEGGIFRYQGLSPQARKKARENHFDYNKKMIGRRLKDYYRIPDPTKKDKDDTERITKVKINEDAMVEMFKQWMKDRDAETPDHFSFRDGLESIRDEDVLTVFRDRDFDPAEYEHLDQKERRDLAAEYFMAPGMIERYLRALSDQEWETLQRVMTWETKLYYLLPGEDYFLRMWRECFLFRTEFHEIQTPDVVREVFAKLDGDKFFQKRRQETSWVRDCAEMASELYGFAPVSQVTKLCNLKSGVRLNDAQVRAILHDITPPQRTYKIDEEHDEIVRRNLWEKVEDMRRDAREDLEFMVPPLSMIGAQHGIFVFPDEAKNVDPVQKHLEKWCGKQDSLGAMESLMDFLANSLPERESMAYLEENLRKVQPDIFVGKSEKDVQDYLRKAQNLGRHLRCRLLRGWTQEEIDRGIAEKKK